MTILLVLLAMRMLIIARITEKMMNELIGDDDTKINIHSSFLTIG